MKAAGELAGALGIGISGSGPSLFAMVEGSEVANRVAAAMQGAFAEAAGLASDRWVGRGAGAGAEVVSEKDGAPGTRGSDGDGG